MNLKAKDLFLSSPYLHMLFSFELMLAGMILLTAMAAGGFSLWWKRRKERLEEEKPKLS